MLCETRTATTTPSRMTPKEPSWQEDGTWRSPHSAGHLPNSDRPPQWGERTTILPHNTAIPERVKEERHTITLQFMQETPHLFKEDCTFQQQIKNGKEVRHKEKMKNHSNTHAKINSALLSMHLAPEGRTQPHKWVLMHCQVTGELGNGLVPGSGEGRWH